MSEEAFDPNQFLDTLESKMLKSSRERVIASIKGCA